MCLCKEMWLDKGAPIPEPNIKGGRHDCGYVRVRNACIEEAALLADASIKIVGEDGWCLQDKINWNTKFAEEMDRLTQERWRG